jgi:hypothetical protein
MSGRALARTATPSAVLAIRIVTSRSKKLTCLTVVANRRSPCRNHRVGPPEEVSTGQYREALVKSADGVADWLGRGLLSPPPADRLRSQGVDATTSRSLSSGESRPECLSRTIVELSSNGVQLSFCVDAEIGSLREVLAHKTVGVLAVYNEARRGEVDSTGVRWAATEPSSNRPPGVGQPRPGARIARATWPICPAIRSPIAALSWHRYVGVADADSVVRRNIVTPRPMKPIAPTTIMARA